MLVLRFYRERRRMLGLIRDVTITVSITECEAPRDVGTTEVDPSTAEVGSEKPDPPA